MSSADHFYVTTPIYYVNGTPHIGHAYTTIAADAIARYQRARGRQVRFLTGTDEHGQKVLQAAQKRGMSPKEHCDDIVQVWKGMMADLQIRYDRFIRTTDPDHVEVVTSVLQKLWDKGLIYKDEYTGWYSAAAERFWTEKDLVDGKCPDTGQPVEKITETNYFFKMSAFHDRLVAWIEENPDCILPASRRNEVLGFLRQPLADLCISRPKSRMSWGIEIPFDREYVTYVWFDALLNYLTGAGYHPDGDDSYLQWWPADYHLIGKDILTTHAVYWTTMLMALEVPLPKHIYAHGWWTTRSGEKMSKSLGNTIDVALLSETFGLDATRYFFLREIGFGHDGGFSYEGFLTRYNADLANDLGNLAHRGLSMTSNWLGGKVPALGARTSAEEELRGLARTAVTTFDRELQALHFDRALEALWELVKAGNKYIDTEQPWALNKKGETERLATVMRQVLEICFVAGALLRPIMPGKAGELLGKLGVTEEHAESWLRAALASGELDLAALPEGGALSVGDPLFPRFRELPEAIQALLAPPPEPKPKKAEKKKPMKTVSPHDAGEPISFDDFARVKLRVGLVLDAEAHPNADKLLVLKVDVGEDQPRTIVAGIRSKFAPEDLKGRKVVVVANLKPAKLRGIESHGMLLAAGGQEVVDLVTVDAEPGDVVR